MALYLIKRGPKPDYHNAPYIPVLVCCNKKVAKWEAGATDARAWVWSQQGHDGFGWLLERWEGLDIDYGHVVRGMPLPNGWTVAFQHPHAEDRPQPYAWDILDGAVWWSTKKLPEWLAKRGIVLTTDDFTLRTITSDEEYARKGY